MLSSETYFSVCFDFFQLPDGRWAGRCTNGEFERLYVSIEAYPKNKTPERFKHEPCELADEAVSNLYYKLTY